MDVSCSLIFELALKLAAGHARIRPMSTIMMQMPIGSGIRTSSASVYAYVIMNQTDVLFMINSKSRPAWH